MMKWPKHLLVLDHLRGPRRAGTAALALAVNSKEAIVTNKMQSRCCYSLTEPSQMKFRLPDRSCRQSVWHNEGQRCNAI
jgi:hypothetical protein